MHLKIAICISAVVTAFVISAAVGGKLSYEVAMTGLLGVLTYWAMPPRAGIQIEQKESDGDY